MPREDRVVRIARRGHVEFLGCAVAGLFEDRAQRVDVEADELVDLLLRVLVLLEELLQRVEPAEVVHAQRFAELPAALLVLLRVLRSAEGACCARVVDEAAASARALAGGGEGSRRRGLPPELLLREVEAPGELRDAHALRLERRADARGSSSAG